MIKTSIVVKDKFQRDWNWKLSTSLPGTLTYQQACGGKYHIFPAVCPYIEGTCRHTRPLVLFWAGCPWMLCSKCYRCTERQTCFVRLRGEHSGCISSNSTCSHRDHQYNKATFLRGISVNNKKREIRVKKLTEEEWWDFFIFGQNFLNWQK